MKFNIELDFEDFEIEEGSITKQLQASIENNIVFKLKEQIDKKVFEQITIAVEKTIKSNLEKSIQDKITQVVESNKIKDRYSSKEYSIEEYILELFSKSDLQKPLQNHIENVAKNMVNDLKKSYDLAFASHVVKNMQANNLLKDEVLSNLISKGE